MKITKEYLQEIIKEELEKILEGETFTKGQKVVVKKSGKQTKDRHGTIEELPVDNPKSEDDLLAYPLVKVGKSKLRINPKNFVKE